MVKVRFHIQAKERPVSAAGHAWDEEFAAAEQATLEARALDSNSAELDAVWQEQMSQAHLKVSQSDLISVFRVLSMTVRVRTRNTTLVACIPWKMAP